MKIASVLPVLVALSLLLGDGCDDKPTIPPNVEEASRKAAQQGPPRPTTQELLHGGRYRVVLAPIPFSVNAPLEWKVSVPKGLSIVLLAGPTPSAEAQVQISSHPPCNNEQFQVITRGALKERSDHPDTVKKAEVRDLSGGVKVLERQTTGTPGPLTLTDEKGHERVIQATPYTWTLTMFKPAGTDKFDRDELNFVGLTFEQYQQDKELLEGIMSSLQYEAGAVSTQP